MRWALSWMLYLVGDLLSKPMIRFDWAWLYPAYNTVMGWSDSVQGDGPGPWKKALETDNGY